MSYKLSLIYPSFTTFTLCPLPLCPPFAPLHCSFACDLALPCCIGIDRVKDWSTLKTYLCGLIWQEYEEHINPSNKHGINQYNNEVYISPSNIERGRQYQIQRLKRDATIQVQPLPPNRVCQYWQRRIELPFILPPLPPSSLLKISAEVNRTTFHITTITTGSLSIIDNGANRTTFLPALLHQVPPFTLAWFHQVQWQIVNYPYWFICL